MILVSKNIAGEHGDVWTRSKLSGGENLQFAVYLDRNDMPHNGRHSFRQRPHARTDFQNNVVPLEVGTSRQNVENV
jgi:hypothetical protein